MSAAVLQEMPLDTQAAVNSGRDSFRPFFYHSQRRKKKKRERNGRGAVQERRMPGRESNYGSRNNYWCDKGKRRSTETGGRSRDDKGAKERWRTKK